MERLEVVDPRFAAGRGDEFRVSTLRQRQDEMIELAAADGSDFKCVCACPLPPIQPGPYPTARVGPAPGRPAAVRLGLGPAARTPRLPVSRRRRPHAEYPWPRPVVLPARLPMARWIDENVDLEDTECASIEQAIPASNVGYRLLQRMGWRPGGGLGREQQGEAAQPRARCTQPCAGPGCAPCAAAGGGGPAGRSRIARCCGPAPLPSLCPNQAAPTKHKCTALLPTRPAPSRRHQRARASGCQRYRHAHGAGAAPAGAAVHGGGVCGAAGAGGGAAG